MNHGTREDKEEEDRYRSEHLVAVCCNMRMDKRVPLSTAVSGLTTVNHSHVERSDEIGSDKQRCHPVPAIYY
jgi:hypothetical protein